MFENNEASTGGTRSAKRSLDYLNRAQCAQQEGNDSLAASLYLAAFDCAQEEGVASEEIFIDGLKQAWFLAAANKQRTFAEHIFSLMEPYLSQDEVERYILRLQDLAFERLQEFGMDRQDIEQIVSTMPAHLAELGYDGIDAFLDELIERASNELDVVDNDSCSNETNSACCDSRSQETSQDSSCVTTTKNSSASGQSSTNSNAIASKQKGSRAGKTENAAANSMPAMPAVPDVMPFLSQIFQGGHGAIAAFGIPNAGQKPAQTIDRLTYADMAGFERAIDQMRSLGIGFAKNPELKNFISFLNEKHGLSGMPVADSLIFRAPAREDAGHFMEATLGELGLPGVRIHIDENIHGDVVLCVLAQTSLGLRFNTAKGQIDGSGVLLLEDIDLWAHLLPFDEECYDCSSGRLGSSNMSKGAYEAARLIRSAVENPDVYVLASCSNDTDISGVFLDMLYPFTVVDLDYPTEYERASLWGDLMNRHPSMKGAQLETLVAYSKGLARFDIYMAAREAVEASYKESLAAKCYIPLTTTAICEKLAAYQPLDSDEYKSLEEQVISDFRQELQELDAYLNFDSTNDMATLLRVDRNDLGSAESADN